MGDYKNRPKYGRSLGYPSIYYQSTRRNKRRSARAKGWMQLKENKRGQGWMRERD